MIELEAMRKESEFTDQPAVAPFGVSFEWFLTSFRSKFIRKINLGKSKFFWNFQKIKWFLGTGPLAF